MRFSIITAVFNSVRVVEEALDSVRSQRNVQVEHIVVDGASTDGTTDILERRRQDFSVFVSEPDLGIYDALNKGISRATGDVVGFLHADDMYAHIDVLKKVADAFEHDLVDAVYGDLVYVSSRDTRKIVRQWRAGQFSRRRLAWGWMPPHPATFIRREWFARVGGFDTQYRIAADYDHILRLMTAPQFNAAYLPEVLVRMRIGGTSNRSLANIVQKSREDYRALKKAGVGGIRALVWKNVSKLGQFN